MQDHHFSDVKNCGASCAADKTRILAKIEGRAGGIDQFNERLKAEVKVRFNKFRRDIASSQMHMPLKQVDPSVEIQSVCRDVVMISSELSRLHRQMSDELQASASLRSTV